MKNVQQTQSVACIRKRKMTDNGFVISTKEDFAQVEVQCFIACQNCSSRSLCAGQSQSKGLLSVKNPLRACPGDEVMIEIPDTKYNKALIFLFGSLLLAALSGMIAGYFSSSFLPLSPSGSSLLGLLIGLALGGAGISHSFHKKNKEYLYPVIIEIIQKGECHG